MYTFRRWLKEGWGGGDVSHSCQGRKCRYPSVSAASPFLHSTKGLGRAVTQAGALFCHSTTAVYIAFQVPQRLSEGPRFTV